MVHADADRPRNNHFISYILIDFAAVFHNRLGDVMKNIIQKSVVPFVVKLFGNARGRF